MDERRGVKKRVQLNKPYVSDPQLVLEVQRKGAADPCQKVHPKSTSVIRQARGNAFPHLRLRAG